MIVWNARKYDDRIVTRWPLIIQHCKQLGTTNPNCSQHTDAHLYL